MSTVVSHSEQPPEHLRGKEDLKLIAYVWWCGDGECDCTEPVIAWQWRRWEGLVTGKRMNIPCYDREAIWTGTFVTRGGGLEDGMEPDPEAELAAECARRGIVLVAAGGSPE